MNIPCKLKRVMNWFDNGTGLRSGVSQCCGRGVRGCPWLNSMWPGMIVFTFVLQAITGFVLWMHYSPSSQTAWESVYYFQHHVMGGWLVRGIHHFAGQVLVALLLLYALQLVLSGVYRRPREFVFWVTVFMVCAALGSCLTGDLLPWDQNRFSATQTRVNFLMLLPGIGGYLYKLVAGGPAFGHLTVTRFFALHVAVLGGGMVALLAVHAWLVSRAQTLAEAEALHPPRKAPAYWPRQFTVNAAACLAVMVVILLLVFQGGMRGDHEGKAVSEDLGAELGAPADPDPASASPAARPEWSFRGLYVFTHFFSGAWQILPIFVIPTCTMLYVLAMPLIAIRFPGHLLNLGVTLGLSVGLVYLSYKSYHDDANDPDYQVAVADMNKAGERAIELAQARGIPPTGALSLLLTDPPTQGPKLFTQHCGSCHAYEPAEGKKIIPDKASAPHLYQFAGVEWLRGMLDPAQVDGPKYFGTNEKFKSGDMVGFVKGDDFQDNLEMVGEETLDDLLDGLEDKAKQVAFALERLPALKKEIGADELRKRAEKAIADDKFADFVKENGKPLLKELGHQKLEELIAALAKGAEAEEIGKGDKGTQELFEAIGCADCHKYYGVGSLGSAPDMTGYGSREWTMDFLSNPADKRFYPKTNDGMPAYHLFQYQPQKNTLSLEQLQVLADFIRGQ